MSGNFAELSAQPPALLSVSSGEVAVKCNACNVLLDDREAIQ